MSQEKQHRRERRENLECYISDAQVTVCRGKKGFFFFFFESTRVTYEENNAIILLNDTESTARRGTTEISRLTYVHIHIR